MSKKYSDGLKEKIVDEYRNGATLSSLQQKYKVVPITVKTWAKIKPAATTATSTTQTFTRPVNDPALLALVAENKRLKCFIADMVMNKQ